MRPVIVILLTVILFSCKHKSTETQTIVKDTIAVDSISQETVLSKFTAAKDTVPEIFIPKGAIQAITDNKLDSSLNINILFIRDYNDQEAPGISKQKYWTGLFKKGDQFYIKKTQVSFTKIKSETDHEGEKNGLSVICGNKDTCVVLISGIDIKTGPIRGIRLMKEELLPGQKEEFSYNNVNYTFYATGFKTDSLISNYKLFIAAKVKGHYINQLLFHKPLYGVNPDTEFGEDVNIIFGGDIDGDNIPDFIIVSSAIASADANLYLSKLAGGKSIVKLVGTVEALD